MDIDYLIDRLEALITSGKRVPLSNKVMVDEQECLDLIDQMRAVVPEEVKAAKRTLLDRERILNDADEDARQIIEQAEQEREIMLSREGLLAEAERRRDEIISEATQEAYELRHHAQTLYDDATGQTQEMREGANNYTMQVLQELENLLGKHLGMVRNGLQSFQQQAQHYQEQIDDYQRQNRPNYAPPRQSPPPENRPAPAPASRPTATSARTNGTAAERAIAERRPTPISNNNNAPTAPERKAVAPANNSPTPVSRGSLSAVQPQLPERRSPAPGNAGSNATNRSINPVPKPNRAADGDDQGEMDDDEFFGGTPPGSPTRPKF